jgi:cation diffusion facilitator family transporter
MSATFRRFVPADLAGRAAALSFLANLVLMVLKITAGLISGSVAVLSDGLDSAQDCVAAGVVFASVRYGARPPDLRHPYGHGRAETIAAILQSLLIAGGGGYIIYRSLDRLMNAPESIGTGLGLVVMLIAAAVSLAVGQYARRIAQLTGSPAIASDARHLMTNVVQALCVLLGLALVALTGEVRIDAIVALALGAYLFWIAWTILWSSAADVLDASLALDEVGFIEQAILAEGSQIEGFHRLRTRRSGQQRFIEMHIVLPPDLTVAQAHEITDRIEARIHSRWPKAIVTIHPEPDDGRFLGPMATGAMSHGREGEQRPG